MSLEIHDEPSYGRKGFNLNIYKPLTAENRKTIIDTIKTEATPDIYYYTMVVLSCTVATYGLLQNSTAVIIGAMLIAPLMHPILGGALALTSGNNNLLRITIKAELTGAILAIVLSAILTLLLPVTIITPEVLARTKPTLLDLVIAIASGAAGTFAISFRSGANLSGVAIATALMPPLCAVGITLALKEYSLAVGALLLFLANMLAINVSAIIIFKIAGFHTPNILDYLNITSRNRFLRLVENKLVFPIVLLCLVTVPLGTFMYKSFEHDRTERMIRETLDEGFGVFAPQTSILNVSFEKGASTYSIEAKLQTTKIISPAEIRSLENRLEYKLTFPVKLVTDVIMVQKVDNQNSEHGFQELLPKIVQKETVEVIKGETPEEIIDHVISEKLSLLPNTRLDDFIFGYRKGTGTYFIDLYLSANEEMEDQPQLIATLENLLEEKLKRRVTITIQLNLPEEQQMGEIQTPQD